MKNLIIYILLLAPIIGIAQNSVIQDDDGETALNLFASDSLSLNINAGEKSLTFSLADKNIPSSQHFYLSGQFKLSGKDGKFPLVSKGEASFQTELGISITYLGDKIRDYFYVTGNLGVSRISLFDSTSLADPIVPNTSVNGSFQVGYNHEALFEFLIVAAAVKLGSEDNIRNIDKLEFNKRVFTDSTFQVVSTPKTVYDKNAYDDNLYNVDYLVDIGWSWAKARLIPMVHLRWDKFPGNDGQVDTFNPGVGLYFTEANKPYSAIFGFQLFYKDFNDNLNKQTDRWERATVNFVAGFKF